MIWQELMPLYPLALEDESGFRGQGDRICFPEEENQVMEALAQAKGKKLRIQGARTGLAGGAVPEGEWVLNLSRLKKLECLENGNLRVQAGVTLGEIRAAAGRLGRWFPPDPTEQQATIGGIFGVRASGPHTDFWGSTPGFVVSLVWVTPQGELWQIPRGKYVSHNGLLPLPDGRTVAGQGDLIDFLSGRGDRLGFALELELKLLDLPKEHWGLFFYFSSEESLLSFGERLREIPEIGKDLGAMEVYNGGAMEILKRNRENPAFKGLPRVPDFAGGALYLELLGDSCDESLLILADLFEAEGGREQDSWAENEEGAMEKLRGLRHGLTEVTGKPLPHGDFQGPRGRIRDMLEAFEHLGFPVSVYGSWESCRLRLDPLDALPAEVWQEVLCKAADWVISAGGSLRGTYGWGPVKTRLFGDRLKNEQASGAKMDFPGGLSL